MRAVLRLAYHQPVETRQTTSLQLYCTFVKESLADRHSPVLYTGVRRSDSSCESIGFPNMNSQRGTESVSNPYVVVNCISPCLRATPTSRGLRQKSGTLAAVPAKGTSKSRTQLIGGNAIFCFEWKIVLENVRGCSPVKATNADLLDFQDRQRAAI